MWRPTSWHDLVLALGQRHEDQQLEFKRQLPSNARDLAKDAAAMSVDGGVIVIGVDENAGVATTIHPLPLSGVVERLRQLIDNHVEPKLEVEISVLRDNPNDGDGVIAITVPRSESGPHQYDGRFPARSGPTTRYLGASEVAALYARGATETAESPNPMGQFVSPPGAGTGGFVGIGRMKLQVSPAREFQHPDQPRLGPALGAAVAATVKQIDDFVDPQLTPATLDWLQRWTPRSSAWIAGEASDQFETLRANRLVAATYSYGGGFSFYSTMGLMPEGMDWRCTYENLGRRGVGPACRGRALLRAPR